jgi:hypothetical protein
VPHGSPRGQGISLGELLDGFACCSVVRPMPVSATASSTQSRPSASLRTRATSPSFVNLQALLRRLSRNLLEPHGVCVERAHVPLKALTLTAL